MSARAPRLLALSAAAVLAAGLGACASGAGNGSGGPSATVSTASTAPSSTSLPPPGSPVTQAQAQQIALAAAGPGASVRHVSPLHVEHAQLVWTFEIAVGTQVRDISVAQATGQVISNGTQHSRVTTASTVTQAEAQQIALATAGPGATVLHVDGPHDVQGQTAWTFEIAVGGQVRDISVAQATGVVLTNELHH